MNSCDVCGKKTTYLVDYYVMLCQECKAEHTDVILLKLIGHLLGEKESG